MLRHIIKLCVVLAGSLLTAPSLADAARVDTEMTAANRAIIGGHVKDGLDRLLSLLRQLDPAKDKDAYWRVSTTIVEFLSQVEDHTSATKVLEALLTTKIHESQPAYAVLCRPQFCLYRQDRRG